MIRFLLVWKTFSSTGAMLRSEVVKPGTSALVESVRNRSTPSSPSRANERRSVIRPSSGSWSILKSPVCSTVPAGRADGHREGVGDRVVDGHELEVERAEADPVTLRDDRLRGVLQPVLAELGAEQGQGELGADQRDVGALAQQVGNRADVVLVTVGQHQRVDGIEPVPDGVEVGQDQVDAGVVLLREQHPAVDDEQAAVVLEDGHVAADLAETTESDHPEPPVRQGRRRGQLGVRMAQLRRPASFRAVRTTSTRASSASTRGRRTVRLSCTPRSCIAALAVITPGARPMIASTTGTSSP